METGACVQVCAGSASRSGYHGHHHRSCGNGACCRRPWRENSMARSKSSARWLKEHFGDEFVKRAQAEGFRSRAAFKLDELLGRDRLLKPGMTVVDLGAAPGGWSQLVRQRLGQKNGEWSDRKSVV